MANPVSRFLRQRRYGDEVIVVSGLPRSGTSMMMKMLDAARLPIMTDHERTADEDNPKGYYEDERVKDLAEMDEKGWLKDARGKVIKVVSSLLNHLPEDNRYKVVFMRRNLHEVLASQTKMLDRRDEESHTEDQALLEMYEAHLGKVEFQLRFRPNFEAFYLDFADVVQDPAAEAARLADFVGGGLDVNRMAGVVDGSLYRNRRTVDGEVAG